MRLRIAFILILTGVLPVKAQNQHWVFGDSVGINFNVVPPLVDTNRIIMNEEGTASIADINGNLLFYVGAPNANGLIAAAKKYVVRNALDSVMPGGDSLNGHSSMTQGVLILPFPYDTTKYYIFHIGHQSNYLNYSVADISLNAGLGGIVSSNNLLITGVTEKMHAVKAANGKDWWLVSVLYNPNFGFQKFKIDSIAITNKGAQLITSTGVYAGQMIFSPSGDKLINTGWIGELFLADFDRCTGQFSNNINIDQDGHNTKYGCSFSPNGRYIYASNLDSIWQYDTQAANISTSKQLLFNLPFPTDYLIGQHMLGPDGKIYIANMYKNSLILSDSLNTHLTVIESPDSPGVACNIAPYSFSLLGKKSFASMPNMVNYNLGQLEGVNCDSILANGLDNLEPKETLILFPNPANERVTIRMNHFDMNKNLRVELVSIDGRKIDEYVFNSIDSETIDISDISSGIYIFKCFHGNQFVSSTKLLIAP